MEYRYTLGFDIGVASIGWSLVEIDEEDIATCILDHGVVIFSPLDQEKGKLKNVVRRDARGLRRVSRRRKERLRRVKALLSKTFELNRKDYNNYFHTNGIQQNNHVLKLKIKGLEEQLTKEEITRICIHYAKNRGFKSNRKIDTKEEVGKMKTAIQGVHEIMKRDNCTVSRAVLTLQLEKNYATIHNVEENYIYGFERSDVEKEINLVLDKQISFGVVNEEFKNQYLEIWGGQRDYSEGPACGPYRVEFETMFGFCRFRKTEPRISRACPSFDVFVALQKLRDLRYYKLDEMGNRVVEDKRAAKYKLTNEQINILNDNTFLNGKI